MYRKYIKRILDIMISAILLLVLSPVFLITALAIRIGSPGPIIFKQTRLGYKAKAFQMYKFRSMVTNAERMGSGVYSNRNDDRVTRIGHIIRDTSIDELPQLVNVLKGEMSIIGPRPPLTYHPWPIDQYTKEQLHMFDVKPGISGWAQINGRKGVEWETRIEMNNYYVDHLSFIMDLKIFFWTIPKVLKNVDNENQGTNIND